MRTKLSIIALVLAAMIVAAVGCQWGQPELEIEQAPIHEVQVNIAESYPEQIFVYIKGGLADSCTTFHDLKTERIDNTINIEVTTERPKDVECAQIYSFFEKNVALGSDFIVTELYIVDVNGVIRTFEYPQ